MVQQPGACNRHVRIAPEAAATAAAGAAVRRRRVRAGQIRHSSGAVFIPLLRSGVAAGLGRLGAACRPQLDVKMQLCVRQGCPINSPLRHGLVPAARQPTQGA